MRRSFWAVQMAISGVAGAGVETDLGVARPRRVLVAILAVCVGVAVAAAGLVAQRTPAPHALGAQRKALQSLPLALQGPVSQALGARNRAYRVAASAGGLAAGNPAQGMDLRFDRAGARVSAGATRVGMSLSAAGYGSLLRPLGSVTPSASANRVLYAHHGLREWYANGPLGLEQGFTVPRPLASNESGPLTLALALAGSAHATLAGGGHALTLRAPGGPALRYAGLSATDARGRVLRSWLELQGSRLLLRVDARGARYPLRIDPFVQQGSKLTSPAPSPALSAPAGGFGESVSLSADGNTALVGAPEANSSVGVAAVFTRSGGVWTAQAELTPSGAVGTALFGNRVALSSDGNTALIGAPGDNSKVGAVWVFTRSEGKWTQQGSKLTGSGETGAGQFGFSVALSSEGSTALIGGPEDNGETGAAWVFTRSGSTWTQQGAKFLGGFAGSHPKIGFSVALSSDGNTALIGGTGDTLGRGAAWVFTRSGSTWSEQQRLTGGGETGAGKFGFSVALSSDGNTGLIGALEDGSETFVGAAWVFTRSGSTWTQQGSKLTGSGEAGITNIGFGRSVALSSDGNTALIGGSGDNSAVGAAWVFTRSEGKWTQQGSKLTGGGETGAGKFGRAAALSSDGNTALVGAPGDNGKGAAWVFTRSEGNWSEQVKIPHGVGAPTSAFFGESAALAADGNTALIGAPGSSNAWVFTRSGAVWSLQQKLSGEPGGAFGEGVALSADGNTALVGEPDLASGAARVFTRSAGTWTEQAKLTGSGGVGSSLFGFSVALSSDGNTALIGGRGDNGNVGAAWVFTRSGSVWSQQGSKLTGSGEAGAGLFADGVAISPDGNTALIGGPDDNSNVGAAWVFTRSGGVWCQQGSKLTGSGAVGSGLFGDGTALSSDGNTALIGAPFDNSQVGAAWVFTRSGGVWSQQGSKLTGSGEVGAGQFGDGTALSSDGNTALIGGPEDNSRVGAAWVFTRSGGVWSQQGSKLTGSGEVGAGKFGDEALALSSDGHTGLIGGPNDNGENLGSAWVFVNAPTVASVTPASGPAGGGTTVTITGTNFTGASAVKFGGANAASFNVNSETSIEATSPAGSGTVDVTVTTSGGTSATSAADHFTYLPTVVTQAASSVRASSALLNGTVNPNGGNVSECKFEYGTTVSYGSSVPCSPPPGSGEGAVAVSASVSGLSPSTTYHYRVVATNAGGTSQGADGELKTLVARHWYRGGSKLAGGVKAPLVAWGGTTNVTISGPAGEFSCKAVAGGVVENPLSGNAGTGELAGFVMYECKAPQCEALVKEKFGVQGRGLAGGENVPWRMELFEGGSPVSERMKLGEPFTPPFGSPKAGEMRIKTVCEVAPTKTVVSTSVFEGEVQPEIGEAAENFNGVSAAHPSQMKLTGASSGSLLSEGGEATLTGALKYLGYTAQEVLGVSQ
jgi:hypothetical protein